MSAVLDITIIDDNIPEGSETFTIEVDSSSLPNGVTTTGEATVAIDNDDCKWCTVIWSRCIEKYCGVLVYSGGHNNHYNAI